MTATNIDDPEVVCGDGVPRPASECVQDVDGVWHDFHECCMVHGEYYHQDDDRVCYVGSRCEWFLSEECTVVNGYCEHEEDVCRCGGCREPMLREHAYTDPGGDDICRACLGAYCCYCYGCGERYWNEDSPLNEDGYCPSCSRPRLIVSYGDKTANTLRSETKNALRFGIELEVEGYETAEAAAKYVRKFLPDTYCTLKRDGSLGEAGVEIVTRPDSMEVHRRFFGEMFNDSPGRALSSWNTGRCGMHVHISRAALSQLQIGKMMCFLNEPAAVNFISKVAGRRPCHWCKVHKKKIGDFKHDTDRYTALNVTGKHTVEIRVFKGTLAESGFMKNLEFVEALVAFTAPASRSIAEATSYRAFCDWLPKKAYPNLHAFLVSKGFIRRRAAA